MYKMNDKEYKKMKKIYDDYTSIDSDKDLNRRKITLYEYKVVANIATNIQEYGKGRTFIIAVANYFKKFGFNVKLDDDGINFIISF